MTRVKDTNLFKKLGAKGQKSLKERLGPEGYAKHMKKISRKGVKKRRALARAAA